MKRSNSSPNPDPRRRKMLQLDNHIALPRPSPKGFLDIPLEVREIIFKYCLQSPSGHITFTPDHQNRGFYKAVTTDPSHQIISIGLLRTCRIFYQECRDLLWKSNKVVLGHLSEDDNEDDNEDDSSLEDNEDDPFPWVTYSTTEINEFQIDERIVSKIQAVTMEIDFRMRSRDPGPLGLITAPHVLENVLHHLTLWESLKSVTILVSKELLEYMSFKCLIETRIPDPEEEEDSLLGVDIMQWMSHPYFEYLKVLKEARGYLSQLDCHMEIFSDRPCFRFDGAICYPDRIFDEMESPNQILLEISQAFGGALYLNSLLCCDDGNLVTPATIPIGELSPGSWSFLSSENEDGSNPQQIYQRIGSRNGSVFERDLAQIFAAMVISATSVVPLEQAINMVDMSCPVFPSGEILGSQYQAFQKYASTILDKHFPMRRIPSTKNIDFKALHEQSISGILTALAHRSDDAVFRNAEASRYTNFDVNFLACFDGYPTMSGRPAAHFLTDSDNSDIDDDEFGVDAEELFLPLFLITLLGHPNDAAQPPTSLL